MGLRILYAFAWVIISFTLSCSHNPRPLRCVGGFFKAKAATDTLNFTGTQKRVTHLFSRWDVLPIQECFTGHTKGRVRIHVD